MINLKLNSTNSLKDIANLTRK